MFRLPFLEACIVPISSGDQWQHRDAKKNENLLEIGIHAAKGRAGHSVFGKVWRLPFFGSPKFPIRQTVAQDIPSN